MISFPVFLVAKEAGGTTDWVSVQLNGQPHLAIFSALERATAFVESLPKDQQCSVREIHGPPELSRELVNLPTALSCVIDYVPQKGTQRVVRSQLLLRHLS